MMTQTEALRWITEIFGEKYENVQPETKRDDIPNWDSIGAITLMAELDEHHAILLDDEQLEALKRIDDILQLLRAHGKLEN